MLPGLAGRRGWIATWCRRSGRSVSSRLFRAGTVRVSCQGTLQLPLRGPAQPLAAVRSDACEAVPRKQCAFTHASSVAASMRLRAPSTHPHHAWTVCRLPNQEQSRPTGLIGERRAAGQSPALRGATRQLPYAVALRFQQKGKRSVGRRRGWVGGTVGRHGWRPRAYRDVLAACPANPPTPTPHQTLPHCWCWCWCCCCCCCCLSPCPATPSAYRAGGASRRGRSRTSPPPPRSIPPAPSASPVH